MYGAPKECRPWTRKRSRSRSRPTLRDARPAKAASSAKAAEVCAVSGNCEKDIDVTLDIEEIVYEVNTFLNVANMINRLGKI